MPERDGSHQADGDAPRFAHSRAAENAASRASPENWFRSWPNPADPQRHGLATLHLDPERPAPAQEQLVLVVVVPRELALESRKPYQGIVRLHDVARLPWLGDERLTASATMP